MTRPPLTRAAFGSAPRLLLAGAALIALVAWVVVLLAPSMVAEIDDSPTAKTANSPVPTATASEAAVESMGVVISAATLAPVLGVAVTFLVAAVLLVYVQRRKSG